MVRGRSDASVSLPSDATGLQRMIICLWLLSWNGAIVTTTVVGLAQRQRYRWMETHLIIYPGSTRMRHMWLSRSDCEHACGEGVARPSESSSDWRLRLITKLSTRHTRMRCSICYPLGALEPQRPISGNTSLSDTCYYWQRLPTTQGDVAFDTETKLETSLTSAYEDILPRVGFPSTEQP